MRPSFNNEANSSVLSFGMKKNLVPVVIRKFLAVSAKSKAVHQESAPGLHYDEDAVCDTPQAFFMSLVEAGAATDIVFLQNSCSESEIRKMCTEVSYPFLIFLQENDGKAVPVLIVPGQRRFTVHVFKSTEPLLFEASSLDELPLTGFFGKSGNGETDHLVVTCFPDPGAGFTNEEESLFGLPFATNRLGVFSRFFSFLASEKKQMLYILLYALMIGLISLTLPLGVQSLINFISSGRIVTSVVILIIFILAGVFLTGLMNIMQLQLVEHIHQRLFAKTAFSFAFRVPRIRMEAVMKYYPPELMNRFFETLSLMKGMSVVLIDFSSAVLQTVFGIILLSFYHPLFLIVGLVLTFSIIVILRVTGPKGLSTALKESAFKYMTANWLEEVARSLGTFKLAGNTNFAMEKTDFYVSNYIAAREEHFSVLKKQYYSFVFFKTAVTAALLILGAILITSREINLGQFVAAEIMIILIMNSIEKIILKLDKVYDVLVSTEKIMDVTGLPLETYNGIDLPIKAGEGISVRLKEVAFRFPDRQEPVLRGVNLDVAAGERVCICGFNDSGKTTLANLLVGLYDSYSGIVSYNGISLRDLNKASLLDHLGDYVSQEGIFEGTVMENIVIGRPACKIENVKWAVEQAGLMDFISSLPDGFNTRLIGGSVRVSESIARKIIIARNIVERPALLVLDDFLMGVERKEKVRILSLLKSPSFSWTVVLVSNDPLIMRSMDKVVLMKEGRVVDQGLFNELIQRNSDLQELTRDLTIS